MTNVLVITAVTILCRIFGVGDYIAESGMDYTTLAIVCGAWGMIGSFISLALSRAMAKWTMQIQLIDQSVADPQLREIVSMVQELSRKAGLPKVPEIGIYDSDEINAFATGPTKSRSLVAVSTGLLNTMDRDEVEGVLGHEISHIANGDMVTMALLQGVVNAFVMFLARAVAYVITRGIREESIGRLVYFLTVMVLQFFFMFLGQFVVNAFSRYREYRADEGGANVAGKEKMIRALQKLEKAMEADRLEPHPAYQAMKISSKPQGVIGSLLASHPPLEDRISKLQQK